MKKPRQFHTVDIDALDWEAVKDHLEPDGSLKDIRIAETNERDWMVLFEYLQSHYLVWFLVDGEPTPLPASVEDINRIQEYAAPALYVQIGSVAAWTVYFEGDEVEFSFEPADIRSMNEFGPIVIFMVDIGRLLQKKIILAWENASRITSEDGMIFCYDPKVSDSKLILRV